MSSPRVGNPRVGVSASCPVTVQLAGAWSTRPEPGGDDVVSRRRDRQRRRRRRTSSTSTVDLAGDTSSTWCRPVNTPALTSGRMSSLTRRCLDEVPSNVQRSPTGTDDDTVLAWNLNFRANRKQSSLTTLHCLDPTENARFSANFTKTNIT